MQNSENSHANLQRRLAALVYDGLLLFAVTMAAGFILVPFTSSIQLNDQGSSQNIFNPFMTAYYLVVYYLFFGWFWTHGGQTLGMRAWRMRLVTSEGKPVNWIQSLVRFLVSLPMWFFCIWLRVRTRRSDRNWKMILERVFVWFLMTTKLLDGSLLKWRISVKTRSWVILHIRFTFIRSLSFSVCPEKSLVCGLAVGSNLFFFWVVVFL